MSERVSEKNQRPATLLEELRLEAAMVPHRRGKLYALAADEIVRLSDQRAPLNAKQVFLYRKGSLLDERDLLALREAGFVPVGVAEFADVKVVDPYTVDTRNAVWMAAVTAIAKANDKEGPKSLFGRLLAEKLSDTSIPAKDAP